ncbi:hypothetical protein [Gloeobacter violaceus]|uniref:hypothetical protein n=1 Tax=Gloeobacter violaceus TaxID=33072 RepID=UPI0013E8D803|nr:hypothetical protein [Gloeobacter violaceus]
MLVLATNYDCGSYSTSTWAATLQADLIGLGHICLLLDATALCRGGLSLQDAVECVDYVVYCGHGLQDEWTALPALGNRPSIPLVDSSSVNILSGRKVYACCCWSVTGLGAAYANRFSHGEYIGYDRPFGFEKDNESEFRNVVIDSVAAFVQGDPAAKVVNDLAYEWDRLSNAFSQGKLKYRRNAIQAAYVANNNKQRIRHVP